MYTKKTHPKVRKFLILIACLMFFLSYTMLSNNQFQNFKDFDNEKDDIIGKDNDTPVILQASSDEYSGIGRPQNVVEYGEAQFKNYGKNQSLSENASIYLPANWNSSGISVDVTNIYEYDKVWLNKTFDTSYDFNMWTNFTDSDPAKVIRDWYDDGVSNVYNDSMQIKLLGDGVKNWQGNNSYLNYTMDLDRKDILGTDWYINLNWKVITTDSSWNAPPGGSQLYCKVVDKDADEAPFKLSGLTITAGKVVNNTWYSAVIAPFGLGLYDLDLPSNISVLFGVSWGNQPFQPNGNYSILLNNITIQFSSIPKPTQINLKTTDITNNQQYTIIDDQAEIGKGNTTVTSTLSGGKNGKIHEFSYQHDSNAELIISSDIYVNGTSLYNTTTQAGLPGTDFIAENNSKIIWNMYYPVDIPWDYITNYYFNVSKPWNWNVTQLIDPFSNDKIVDVIDTSGIGNTTLTIPNNIKSYGRWKIVAESSNYVLDAKVWRNSVENTSFIVGDQVNITANINNTPGLVPNFANTKAQLKTYYPNGSLWSGASSITSVDGATGNVNFPNFDITALNAPAGKYSAHILWNSTSPGNDNLTQVGFYSLNFYITHNTLLNYTSDLIEKSGLISPIFSGEEIIIKVNYTDLDTDEGIIGAELNYTIDNATVIKGDMALFGDGVYIATIDTSGWTRGLYNVSITANKSYYKLITKLKLIKLEITESTNITSPQIAGLSIPWGSNAIIDIEYKSTSTHLGISEASVTLPDWGSGYTEQDLGSGKYRITILTATKNVGAYSVKIETGRAGFENQTIYISISIRGIFTELTYTTPGSVSPGSTVSIPVQYKDVDNDVLIPGAGVYISSQSDSQFWSSASYTSVESSTTPGTYTLSFNSNVFGGTGSYQIYLKANKTNYADALSTVNIFVQNREATISSIFINGVNKTLDKSVEVPIRKIVNITVNYVDIQTKANITSGTLEIEGTDYSESFLENTALKHYYVSVNTSELGIGTHFLTITGQKSSYVSVSAVIKMKIEPINITIQTVTGEDLIEIKPTDIYTLRFLIEDSDFMQPIENLTVGYTIITQGVLYERGVLLDPDGDGIFEKELITLPVGTYTITISVTAGNDYEITSHQVDIVSAAGEEQTELMYIIVFSAIGVVSGLSAYIVAYQKVLKYPKPVRKIRKLKSKLKKEKTVEVEVTNREAMFKDIYVEELIKRAKFLKAIIPEKSFEQILSSKKISKQKLEGLPEKITKNIPDDKYPLIQQIEEEFSTKIESIESKVAMREKELNDTIQVIDELSSKKEDLGNVIKELKKETNTLSKTKYKILSKGSKGLANKEEILKRPEVVASINAVRSKVKDKELEIEKIEEEQANKQELVEGEVQNEFKPKIENTEAELSSLQEDWEEAINNTNNWKVIEKDLNDTLKTLQKERDSLGKEKERALNKSLKDISVEKKEKLKKIEPSDEAEIGKIEQEFSDMVKSAEKKVNDDFALKVSDVESKLEKNKNSLEEITQNITEWSEKLTLLETKIKSLKKKREDIINKSSQAVRTRHEELVQEKEKKINDIRDQVDSLEKNISKIEMETLEKEVSMQTDKYDQQIKGFEAKIEIEEKNVDDISQKITALNGEIKGIEASIRDLNKEKSGLFKEQHKAIDKKVKEISKELKTEEKVKTKKESKPKEAKKVKDELSPGEQ
jgi:hypothetical protein